MLGDVYIFIVFSRVVVLLLSQGLYLQFLG